MDLANEGLAFPKQVREKEEKKGLQAKTPLKAKTKLKSHYEPIDKKLKEEVLKVKGTKCFLGFCICCGGQAEVTINDDFHHYKHKSQGGKDRVEDLWPCRRECHDFMHLHPALERTMFEEMLQKANERLTG